MTDKDENSDRAGKPGSIDPSSPTELGSFAARVRVLVGNESVRAFSRRSGVAETTLRAYMAGTSDAGRLALIGMAQAGGVSVEWLATGREAVLASPEAAQNQAVERELAAIEETLQGVSEVPVPEYIVSEDQKLAGARRTLREIAARPDSSPFQKAHAEMLLRLVFGDQAAANRADDRLKQAGERLRWMNKTFEDAVKAVEYCPPPAIAETIKNLMFSHGLDAEGTVLLLSALKQHLPPPPDYDWSRCGPKLSFS